MIRCRTAARLACLTLIAAALTVAACSSPREPIVVDEGYNTIENQTSSAWRTVKVTVNDYYGGTVPELGPGGRLNVPLSQLQTGLGQKFDRGRQSVSKVEVTATDADGKPVKLSWGNSK
jgi:hypothetical protein